MSVPTKISRVLKYLIEGRSLNRFEAAQRVNDWCLHSTIAELQSRGVPVFRQMETVPGYRGSPTRVARYRIVAGEDRDRAREVLEAMEGKRKPAVAAAGRKSGVESQSNVRAHRSTSAVEAHPGPRGGGRES